MRLAISRSSRPPRDFLHLASAQLRKQPPLNDTLSPCGESEYQTKTDFDIAEGNPEASPGAFLSRVRLNGLASA